MKKTLFAVLSLIVSSTAFAVNCNLPNIKGQWGGIINSQNGAIVVNMQCQYLIGSVPGNAATAPVSGSCLDLVTGFWGVIQPESWVGFVGKSCQLQGQIVTQVSSLYPQTLTNIFQGNLITNLNLQVSTNKKAMVGTLYSSGTLPNWWSVGTYSLAVHDSPTTYNSPLSGSFSGIKGETLEPIGNVLSQLNYYAGLVFPYAPSTPAGSSNGGNGKGKK